MSTAPLFSVSDPVELLALWRLVAEAKFQSSPDDTDLWSSPYVHALAQRISDSQLKYSQDQGDEHQVQSHFRWVASLPNNIVLPVVQAQLKNDATKGWWSQLSREQKLAYVQGCVAPFEPGIEFLGGLIRDAEA